MEKDMKNFSFDSEEQIFKNKNKKICIGDEVHLNIKDLKYENGNYRCISELV